MVHIVTLDQHPLMRLGLDAALRAQPDLVQLGAAADERELWPLIYRADPHEAFFRQAAPQDRIGLTKFSTDITRLVPIAPLRKNRRKLAAAVKTLLPDGDTRVRDAAVEAVKAVEAKLDPDAINAVVLLTDGADTVSSRGAEAVVRELEVQSRKESGQVRVFTIAYGREPNETELARYAAATGGKAYEGTKDDVESIYLSISSFF